MTVWISALDYLTLNVVICTLYMHLLGNDLVNNTPVKGMVSSLQLYQSIL